MKRRWPIIVVLVVVAAIVLSRGGKEPVKEVVSPAPRPVAVSVEEVTSETLTRLLQVRGQVRPVREVNVVPKIGGVVCRLEADVGQRVAAGDVLLELEGDELRAQVRQAEAALTAARAGLEKLLAGPRPEELAQIEAAVNQAETNFRKAEANLERMEELHRQGIITKDQWEGAVTAYEVAEAQLNSAKQQLALALGDPRQEDLAAARAQVQQAEANLELAKLRLGYTVITSPMDGVVAFRYAENGGTVGVGTPVFTIVDIDRVIVNAQVTESYANRFRPGEQVDVRIDALGGQVFPGIITAISPMADQSRSFPTRIEIANPQHLLKPGMAAEVIFVTDSREAEMAIPARAVLTGGDVPRVFVVEEGVAREREVVLGLEAGELVEVLAGLALGELVVVRGQNYLEDGTVVNITEQGW